MTIPTEYYKVIRREPNLISYWRLGGSDLTGTSAVDFAGRYGINGIYNGSPESFPALISAVNNEKGYFLPGSKKFGSVGQNIEVPDAVPLRIAGDITIEGWLIDLAEDQTGWVIGKVGEKFYLAAPYCIILTENDRKLLFAIGNGETQVELYSSTAMPLSVPIHFVATSFKKKMKLYINGVLSGTKTIESLEAKDNKQPVYIGENGGKLGGSNFNFSGICGELALYNRALSARSIKEHYAIGRQIIYQKPFYTKYDIPSYS